MDLPTDIRPDERILVLGLPGAGEIEALSQCVPAGLVVAMGEDEDVRAARKALVHLANVMCVPGTPDEIPWRDGYFSRVIDTAGDWPDPERVRNEVRRVTSDSHEG